jgi:threonine dehydrogenase-like Zn-dependent dehydrogenase
MLSSTDFTPKRQRRLQKNRENYPNSRNSFQGISLAELRSYPIEKMVTHRFPLEEAERAARLVGGEIEGEEAIKVVMFPWRPHCIVGPLRL